MRVRISYGVELEEIPKHASNLGDNALTEIKESVRSLERILEHVEEEREFSSILVSIEKIRLNLTKADAVLSDMGALLEGLQNYKNGEQNVSERRPTVDPGGNTIKQTKNPGQG